MAILNGYAHWLSSDPPQEGRHTVPTSTSSAETPLKQETPATALPLVRDSLTSRGISNGAAKNYPAILANKYSETILNLPPEMASVL